ncbi:hypothetical protein M011DRAFT_115662 [Sporormia fimetaria CBS 119925]|uniref:Uncharacterized protein n=1 Tax=Sporormia fimetaria CBS 119925 TaxID=1340428 RepID=A0A6A6VQC1_9PLEO|nr:hypothetical protein M011DRAFT_115662 [Sporormia fimetaria CBS 119925]
MGPTMGNLTAQAMAPQDREEFPRVGAGSRRLSPLEHACRCEWNGQLGKSGAECGQWPDKAVTTVDVKMRGQSTEHRGRTGGPICGETRCRLREPFSGVYPALWNGEPDHWILGGSLATLAIAHWGQQLLPAHQGTSRSLSHSTLRHQPTPGSHGKRIRKLPDRGGLGATSNADRGQRQALEAVVCCCDCDKQAGGGVPNEGVTGSCAE